MKRFFSSLFNVLWDREIDAIAQERAHQKTRFTAKHDDTHRNRELIWNAENILLMYQFPDWKPDDSEDDWGLARKHRADPEKLLCIAGALVAAELSRLRRAKRIQKIHDDLFGKKT